MPPLPARLELNGHAAITGLELFPALGGYGHFTAMQVRGGRVRGLDFHLARLDAATRELFGVELSGERILAHLRHALGDDSGENDDRDGTTRDASVRINVFSPDGSAEPPAGVEPEISVLLTVRPPYEMPAGPLTLCSVPYQRPFAHIKHVGGFAQGHYIKLVERRGFDEPLLVGEGGLIAEGAITNVGFIQGDAVVWPQAPMLLGIGMQVLQRELSAADVPQHHRRVLLDDLAAFDGAFVTNSRGIATVRRIDELDIPLDAPLLAHVLDRCAQAPWDAI
ncbi:aminotransferase class IV [Actinocrinis sp.]|uniref:aminotransferase class IV n=1 Tax=Actinocrinis sp. TaxID=1920516 RepID=UPI002BE3CA6D|nr:aminotransferase class IV [Actinocrinis sp.]HXR73585.1 aminotransferase class IV [Actinocrinis sp.]